MLCRKGVRKNAVSLRYALIVSYFLIFYFIHQGSHGSVCIDGCIKSICTNGKWKPKMRTDVCCYKQQVKFYMFNNLSCIWIIINTGCPKLRLIYAFTKLAQATKKQINANIFLMKPYTHTSILNTNKFWEI